MLPSRSPQVPTDEEERAALTDELPEFNSTRWVPFPTGSKTPRTEWQEPEWWKPEYYDDPLHMYHSERQIKACLSRLKNGEAVNAKRRATRAINAPKEAAKRLDAKRAKAVELQLTAEKAQIVAGITRDLKKPEWAIAVLEADEAKRRLKAHLRGLSALEEKHSSE